MHLLVWDLYCKVLPKKYRIFYKLQIRQLQTLDKAFFFFSKKLFVYNFIPFLTLYWHYENFYCSFLQFDLILQYFFVCNNLLYD